MNRTSISSQRLQNQHLTGPPLATAVDVVRWLGAVQSQDYAGAKWAIAQRVVGVTDAELDRLFDAGAILRTHILRPTWHFVLPEDIRWMLMLTAPRVHQANGHYYRKLELDDAIFARSNAVLAEALRGAKYLTRAELTEILDHDGISVSGLRSVYLIMRAELDGVICSGPRRGKQFTYALLDERAPNARTMEREEALAELTKQYFTSHGPALIADFVWWSGLTTADARTGIEMNSAHLIQEIRGGKTYWFASSTPAVQETEPIVHLLPNFDEFLVAYKDRTQSYVGSPHNDSVALGNIVAVNNLMVDGQTRGIWQRTIQKTQVNIDVIPHSPLNEAEREALASATKRYGQFLGMSVDVVAQH